MDNSSSVDLSQLPPPSLVETVDFEAIYDEMVAKFQELWAAKRAANSALPEINVLNLETDPLASAFQVFAYREVLLRSRINHAGRSNLLAFAVGGDLDQLAANVNVFRLVVRPATPTSAIVMESDDRLRRRVQLAIEAFSVAGPAGAYIFHAMTTDPTLQDATAVSPSPGRVMVTVMKSAEDPTPTQEQLTKISLALSADDVRPLTDMVSVVGPEVIMVPVIAELVIYPGPDGNIVATQAKQKLEQFLKEISFLGRDLRRSAIFSRLHVEGVNSVEIISPAEDIVVGPGQAVKVSNVAVTISGVGT